MNLWQKLLVQWRTNAFLRNNIIVFFGSGLSSFLSYMFYPTMARLLPLSDFGEVQTLVSLLTQATLIFSAINIVAVVLIASNKVGKNQHEDFIRELQKLMIYATTILGVITAIFAPFIMGFFQFHSIWLLFITILAFILNVPFVFWSAYLQGKENFFGANMLGVVAFGARLVLAVAFALIGWGAIGAMLGLLLGQVIAMSYCQQKYKLPSISSLFDEKLPNWSLLKKEINYTLMVIVVSVSITLLYTGDILLVKHFEDPDVAGAYAGIASIARIIFFLTLPFTMVLLPAVHSNWKQRTQVLKRSFTLVIGLGTTVMLIFWFFAPHVIRILVGARYVEYSYILPELSLAILLISIANLLFYYLLSVRSISSLYISLIGLFLFFGLSFFYNQSVDAIVGNLIISGIVTLVLLVLTMSLWPRVRPLLIK